LGPFLVMDRIHGVCRCDENAFGIEHPTKGGPGFALVVSQNIIMNALVVAAANVDFSKMTASRITSLATRVMAKVITPVHIDIEGDLPLRLPGRASGT
jgi:hypothetical protein